MNTISGNDENQFVPPLGLNKVFDIDISQKDMAIDAGTLEIQNEVSDKNTKENQQPFKNERKYKKKRQHKGQRSPT